jgi:hypothetical protein
VTPPRWFSGAIAVISFFLYPDALAERAAQPFHGSLSANEYASIHSLR